MRLANRGRSQAGAPRRRDTAPFPHGHPPVNSSPSPTLIAVDGPYPCPYRRHACMVAACRLCIICMYMVCRCDKEKARQRKGQKHDTPKRSNRPTTNVRRATNPRAILQLPHTQTTMRYLSPPWRNAGPLKFHRVIWTRTHLNTLWIEASVTLVRRKQQSLCLPCHHQGRHKHNATKNRNDQTRLPSTGFTYRPHSDRNCWTQPHNHTTSETAEHPPAQQPCTQSHAPGMPQTPLEAANEIRGTPLPGSPPS